MSKDEILELLESHFNADDVELESLTDKICCELHMVYSAGYDEGANAAASEILNK